LGFGDHGVMPSVIRLEQAETLPFYRLGGDHEGLAFIV
jgi:hypothetical protein